MLAIGAVAFESPAHAARAYPELWPSAEAAKKAMSRETDQHHSKGLTTVTQVEFEALIRALLAEPVQDTERDELLLAFIYAARPAVANELLGS